MPRTKTYERPGLESRRQRNFLSVKVVEFLLILKSARDWIVINL